MPFAMFVALSLAAATPPPTYVEAVQCAAAYQLSGNLKLRGYTHEGLTNVGRVGVEWLAYAAQIGPTKADTLIDLARTNKATVRTLLATGSVRGWDGALAAQRAQCERLQKRLPETFREIIEELQSAIKKFDTGK